MRSVKSRKLKSCLQSTTSINSSSKLIIRRRTSLSPYLPRPRAATCILWKISSYSMPCSSNLHPHWLPKLKIHLQKPEVLPVFLILMRWMSLKMHKWMNRSKRHGKPMTYAVGGITWKFKVLRRRMTEQPKKNTGMPSTCVTMKNVRKTLSCGTTLRSSSVTPKPPIS